MTDHQIGFIEYGMSRQLPPDASEDEQLGYRDHRENMISLLSVVERSSLNP